MRILYLAHSCPFPPNKGDRIRSFNILKYLSSRHEVDLVYPSFSAQDVAYQAQLAGYCRSVGTVRLSPLLSAARCCVSLLTNRSFTEVYFYSRRLARLIRHRDCDVILVDCSSMSPYVQGLEKPKVLDFVDVDSDKWRLFSRWSAYPKSWVYGLEARRLQRLEGELARTFDASLVVSERERALLLHPERTVVVPNGVDLERQPANNSGDGRTLVFAGAMNYFANIDGILHFHKEVFPLIRRKAPDVKFLIVGMQPSAKIKRLQSPDTVVTGYVPNTAEYLAQATVCVVPLRIACGIQNKVLEAMAAGTPIVATSAANSGINAVHGSEMLIADTPEAFAEAVVSLLSDETLRRRLAGNARKLVEQNFRWETNLQRLEEALRHASRQATRSAELPLVCVENTPA